MNRRLIPSLLPLAALAACGDLPQPFAGNPGADALRLAAPPPARLDVPPPGNALLGDAESVVWSKALVKSLLDKEVPAVAQPVRPGDWSLQVAATLSGAQVVPTYRILGPNGRVRATQAGAAVPARDWSSADPSIVAATASVASATISTMLTGLQAQAAQADPNSLLNRPTRIWFGGVTGAPGNGNAELAIQMRSLLPDAHDTLQTDETKADYKVSGQVSVSKPQGDVQHIEIVWTVIRAQDGKGGHEAGKATQLHDVPAHSLDGYWGDTAMAAAQEASGGIHEVIANNEGKPHGAAGGATGGEDAAPPGAQPATPGLSGPPPGPLPKPGPLPNPGPS